jgi:hypothetical protein
MAFEPPSISITTLDGGLSQGTVAAPDGPMWILGMASQGALTPFNTSQPTDIKTTFGYGDGVEASLFALNNELRSITFLRVDPTDAVDGAYGSITVESPAVGLLVVGDVLAKPTDLWEPVVKFTKGGRLSVTGIQYQYSLDNGGKFSGTKDLGTATSITLPFGAGKYDLTGNELALLILRVSDTRTEFLAHTATGTGFHGAVDPGSPYSIATPINDATVLTACANLRTHALTHVVALGSVHGAADATALAAITALVAPSNRTEAIAFIEAFITAFFGDGATVNSGHTLRTASTVHASVDATNLITSDPTLLDDIRTGDMFYLGTTAKRWHIDQLVTALLLVRDSNLPINGVLEIVGNINTNAEAQAIEDALDQIATKYRDVAAVGHFRPRSAGESLQAYADAFAAAHPIGSRSGRRGRLTLTASGYVPSQQWVGGIGVRPASFATAPRLARTRISTNAIYASAQPPVGFGTLKMVLRDSSGAVLPRAVDETFAGVCTPVSLWAPLTDDNTVAMSRPVTLAEDGSDFGLIHYRRVLDAVRKSAQKSLKKRMGQGVAPKPGTVFIDPNEASRISSAESKSLQDVYVKNGDVDGVRVVVLETSVVSGGGPKVTKAKIFVRPIGYIEDIEADLQFEL